MTFHGTKKTKPQQGKRRKTLLSWQRISKAAALTNFKAFWYIVGFALDKHDYKGLGQGSCSWRTLLTFLFWEKNKIIKL